MTRSFHVSRLAEIAEAAPVERVAFPGRSKIAALRRTLKQLRGLMARKRRNTGPAGAPPSEDG